MVVNVNTVMYTQVGTYQQDQQLSLGSGRLAHVSCLRSVPAHTWAQFHDVPAALAAQTQVFSMEETPSPETELS